MKEKIKNHLLDDALKELSCVVYTGMGLYLGCIEDIY